MKIPWRELLLVCLVVVVAFLCAMAIAFIFDGLQPANVFIRGENGDIIEVPE